MHRILAAVAIIAASAPLALLGTPEQPRPESTVATVTRHPGGRLLPRPATARLQPDPRLPSRRHPVRHPRCRRDLRIAAATTGSSANGGADLLLGNRGDDTLIDNQPAFFGNVATLRGGSGNDVCIGNANDVFLRLRDGHRPRNTNVAYPPGSFSDDNPGVRLPRRDTDGSALDDPGLPRDHRAAGLHRPPPPGANV